ncbi:unnamed protein product [Schistosoma curassoni]|uniref:Uncharacterized protein n=1 Tax=Schistosoma curassoni TaxID=6186 RepID=A0A183JTS2_9TREM|nr:unnamed protein product [Schistosoma curassoni]
MILCSILLSKCVLNHIFIFCFVIIDENFVQSESDPPQKTDQSSLLFNSEHASLINQLTEVINNATAQRLLLSGNNYISSMNALYNDAQQSQQPILNNQVALSNYLSRQISTQQQNQLENVTSVVKVSH